MINLSKTRLSEIESLPDDTIDTLDIPELDDDFWKNAQRVVPENYLQSYRHSQQSLKAQNSQ